VFIIDTVIGMWLGWRVRGKKARGRDVLRGDWGE
jgi:hypothetical protein